MSEKACRTCHAVSYGASCPKCKSQTLSDDFNGLVIIFTPEDSEIAKVMGIKEKGKYALHVR